MAWRATVTFGAVLLGLGAGPAHALEARALVDRTAIAADDVLGLTVVVTDGDGAVDTSPIRDFAVAERGRTSSVQIVNTRMTREVQYRFALTPLRTGTLTVPALTVGEGRDAAVTDPVTVQVAPRGAGTAAGTPDLAVEAEVSDSTPFVGQEITYTFRLLATTQLADARYQAPRFEGFSATPLEEQRRYTRVQNGREVSVTELTYLLVPLRAGTLVIDSARLSCQVPVGTTPQRRRDPFGLLGDPFGRGMAIREKSLLSAPVELRVAALPPPPPGQRFSGLVGRFQLSAAVSPATVAVGESATLTLVLEGEGNVGEAVAPALGLPTVFKVYPDDPEASLTRDPTGSRGSLRFRFALVPTEAGVFTLGPFPLLTFDSAAGTYRSVQAGPLAFTVRPGAATASPALPPPAPDDDLAFEPRREVTRRGHDILGLYTGLDAARPPREWGTGALIAAMGVPVALYLLAWGVSARRGRKPTAAEEQAARCLRHLAAAKAGPDRSEPWAALRRALVAAVYAAAGRRGESLTPAEVQTLLGAAHRDRAADVVALLGRLDAARYGGAAAEAELAADTERAVRSLLRGVKS